MSKSIEVPYVDLGLQHQSLKAELLDAVASVIEHGHFVLGPEVTHFEDAFAELIGVKHAIGLNSGTDALVLALRALGIGPGDEVITTPNTFIATVSAIMLTGARAVLVDAADDYNINLALLENAITEHTKAVIPVHLTGNPARMTEIQEIAERHSLKIIEDAAQAIMARHKDNMIGSLGDVGCFSTHPLKTLNSCGDGGVITTNNTAVYEHILLQRNLGLRTREDCILWSSNSRLDSMQAAILLAKLPHLKSWTEKRQENAAFYREQLTGTEDLCLPIETPDCEAVYHTFVVRAKNRDELKNYLAERGIGTSIHYPTPIHLTEAGKELGYETGAFPVAEQQAKEILSLPIHQDLTEEQRAHVASAVNEFYQK